VASRIQRIRPRALEALVAGLFFSLIIDLALGVSLAWIPVEAVVVAPGFFAVRLFGDWYRSLRAAQGASGGATPSKSQHPNEEQ
jgi:uncharacterized membrane protein